MIYPYPSNWEAEAEELLQIQCQPGLSPRLAWVTRVRAWLRRKGKRKEGGRRRSERREEQEVKQKRGGKRKGREEGFKINLGQVRQLRR